MPPEVDPKVEPKQPNYLQFTGERPKAEDEILPGGTRVQPLQTDFRADAIGAAWRPVNADVPGPKLEKGVEAPAKQKGDVALVRETEALYSMPRVMAGYRESINTADQIDQQDVAKRSTANLAVLKELDAKLASGQVQGEALAQLKKQQSDLQVEQAKINVDYFAPATTRANFGLAMVSSGNEMLVAFGERMLKEAAQLRPEILNNPHYTQNVENARLLGEKNRKLAAEGATQNPYQFAGDGVKPGHLAPFKPSVPGQPSRGPNGEVLPGNTNPGFTPVPGRDAAVPGVTAPVRPGGGIPPFVRGPATPDHARNDKPGKPGDVPKGPTPGDKPAEVAKTKDDGKKDVDVFKVVGTACLAAYAAIQGYKLIQAGKEYSLQKTKESGSDALAKSPENVAKLKEAIEAEGKEYAKDVKVSAAQKTEGPDVGKMEVTKADGTKETLSAEEFGKRYRETTSKGVYAERVPTPVKVAQLPDLGALNEEIGLGKQADRKMWVSVENGEVKLFTDKEFKQAYREPSIGERYEWEKARLSPEEAKRVGEEAAKAKEEAAKVKAAEDAKVAEEAAKVKAAEDAKVAEEAAKVKAAEDAKVAEEAAKVKAAEDAKVAEEAAKVKAAEDAKVAEEAAKVKAAEDAKVAEEAAKVKAAEDAKVAEEAAKVKAAEDAKVAEEAAKVKAAEAEKAAEVKAAEAEKLAAEQRFKPVVGAEIISGIKVGQTANIEGVNFTAVGKVDDRTVFRKGSEIKEGKTAQNLDPGKFNRVEIQGETGTYFQRQGTESLYRWRPLEGFEGKTPKPGQGFLFKVDGLEARPAGSPITKAFLKSAEPAPVKAPEPAPEKSKEVKPVETGEKAPEKVSKADILPPHQLAADAALAKTIADAQKYLADKPNASGSFKFPEPLKLNFQDKPMSIGAIDIVDGKLYLKSAEDGKRYSAEPWLDAIKEGLTERAASTTLPAADVAAAKQALETMTSTPEAKASILKALAQNFAVESKSVVPADAVASASPSLLKDAAPGSAAGAEPLKPGSAGGDLKPTVSGGTEVVENARTGESGLERASEMSKEELTRLRESIIADKENRYTPEEKARALKVVELAELGDPKAREAIRGAATRTGGFDKVAGRTVAIGMVVTALAGWYAYEQMQSPRNPGMRKAKIN